MRSKFLRRVIDRLETRRLLVVYTGTAGPDTVIITAGISGPGPYVSVQINGGAVQSTSGVNVTINTLGGPDSVYFPQLERTFNSSVPFISLNLGDGDDYATNYNPSNGVASTADIDFGVQVIGGNGNDTVDIDATGGQSWTEQTFKTGQLSFRSSVALLKGSMQFDSTVESVIADGSNSAETWTMDSKYAAQKVTVNGNGGNDLFLAGYRDITVSPNLDVNFSGRGWSTGTTTLSGGSGADEIQFYDHTAAAGSYAEENFTLTKGSEGFTYTTFETQRISPGPGSTLSFNNMTSAISQTYVLAEPCTINVGNLASGSLNNISGTFNFSFYGSGNALNFNDANDTGSDLYALTAGMLQKGIFTSQFFYWTGPVSVTLNTGQGGTSTYVRGVAADATLVVNGGPSADTVRVDPGDIDANILGPVFLNGGGGTGDEVTFDDHLDTTAGVITLYGSTFTDGTSITTAGFEHLIVEAGSGPGALLNVPRATVTTTLSSPDTTPINIGGGNLDANLLADVSVTSGGAVTVDDHLATTDGSYFITGLTVFKGAGRVEMGTVVAAILQCGEGDDYIDIESGASPLSVHANGGNDQIYVADTGDALGLSTIGIDTGSEHTAANAPFGDQLIVDSDAVTVGDYGASVRILNDDVIDTLHILAGGRVQLPTGVPLRAKNVSNTGVIDMAGGSLLLSGAAAANVPTWLRTGRNGGAWNGSGAGGAITSSLANSSAAKDGVGYGLGSQVTPTFVGTLPITATDTLVRYTLDGDANLDLVVGFADLVRLAQNYNASGRSWTAGDFDYDAAGTVSFADLVKLAQNYNQTAVAPAVVSASAIAKTARKRDDASSLVA